MIRIIQSSSLLAIFLCMLMAVQFAGCDGDTDDDEADVSEAPPLPPEESMMVDLSTFDETVPGAPGALPFATYKNFGNAAIRVGTISSGLIASVSIPAAVFAAAILYEPEQQGTDTWVWSYSVTVEYVTFTAALTGVRKGVSAIDWSMVVSTNAPLHPVQDFLWYTGTSDIANLAGSWQFYDVNTPTEQNPSVAIDWSASEDGGTFELAIESVDPRAENEYFGDVLSYNATAEDMASLSYEDTSENELWEIIWNFDTGEGSIKVPGYNNGEKACWNSLKQDIECD